MPWASAWSPLHRLLISSCIITVSASQSASLPLHTYAAWSQRSMFTWKSNRITFLLDSECLPRVRTYTSHRSLQVSISVSTLSVPAYPASPCIGIQQTSSCQQEVALTLLFSVLWASSPDPLFLPHGVKFTWTTPTRLACMPIFPTPRHLKPGDLLLVLGTPILELLSLDSNLLVFPANTPWTQLTQW